MSTRDGLEEESIQLTHDELNDIVNDIQRNKKIEFCLYLFLTYRYKQW